MTSLTDDAPSHEEMKAVSWLEEKEEEDDVVAVREGVWVKMRSKIVRHSAKKKE